MIYTFLTKMTLLLPTTATFLLAFLIFLPMVALCQNCSCSSDLCCSKYGYCGSGEEYCGSGCQQGSCFAQAPINGVAVHNIVTKKFFNGIISHSDSTCVGRRFYSRSSFINALKHFPRFGRIGSIDDSKREVAAFFAHVTHETGHFCYIDEINGTTRDYCDSTNTEYKCVKNKSYHGRGPIQLSWNFNYGPAGESLKFDGLNEPEKVGQDPVLSFKTALWYWMKFVQSKMSEGFGSTIRAINNMECGKKNDARVSNRIKYYQEYCSQFNVLPGTNLTC